MRPLLALATAALTLVGLVGASRSAEPTTLQWLSDQAFAYVGSGARLTRSNLEEGPWELVEGTIRIACRTPVHLVAGGRDVVIEEGLATIAVDGRHISACVEEGALLIDEHRIAAGDCAELGTDGQLSMLEPSSADAIAPRPPAIGDRLDSHPAVQDDPMLALDLTLGSLGIGSAGAAAEGENVEAGGTAACLDSSSSGADAVGPDTPDIVAPEVDRDGHIVHVEVTLEDF